MERIVISAVALALCFHLGGSLLCYYCPYETSSSQCTDVKNCSSSALVCKTTVLSPDVGFPFTGDEVVIRDCTSTCLQSSDDDLGNSRPIICCNADLCNNRGLSANNSAAPTSPGVGVLAVGMSVALITLGL